MAKAPRPGVGQRNEDQREAQKVMRLTIHRELFTTGKKSRPIPETHELAPGNLPMRERTICRKATGLPFSSFWTENAIDIDSLLVLWWMARRANGEASLTLAQAEEEFPTDLGPEDIDVEIDDGSDEDEDVNLGEDPSPEG